MRNNKVYIAAPWIHRDQARVIKHQFIAAGFRVSSTWIDGHGDTDDELRLRAEAEQDYDDIVGSDIFVIINSAPSQGKATELGFALEAGIPVILVGDRTGNIFYHLYSVNQVDTIEEAIELASTWVD